MLYRNRGDLMKFFYINKLVSIHRFYSEKPYWHAEPRNVHYLAYHTMGENVHIVGGREFPVHVGTLLFLNAKDAYDVQLTSPSESLCAVFSADTNLESFALDCTNYPYIQSTFQSLLSMSDIQKNDNFFSCMSLLYGIFDQLGKLEQSHSVPGSVSEKLRPAMAYLEENYLKGDVSNRILAELCGLSQRRFITLFQQFYGKTPNQYLIHKKIALAASLLETGMYNISQAAEMSGFPDLYYFSKLFKHKMQETPTQYRKRCLKNSSQL